MSAASNIHSLLARLLPERIVPLPAIPRRHLRLFAGVGLPTQWAVLGERSVLVSRLDEAVDVQAIYSDLRIQALQGNPAVLNDLGWIWLNGRYWRADTALASHLLRMAALQGNAAAWYNLGQQHYFGKGVPVCYANAAQYYRHAFESGLSHAAAALGDLYEEEVCETDQDWQVDAAEAYAWFMRGAQRGEARCRFEVGYRQLHGLHVRTDVKAGLYWLELAAGAGVMQAAEELAVHFSRRDASRYLDWRDQAIALGSKLALTMKLEDQVQP
ncbi:sel1 repeat family protein [Pseudomonas sp. S75]|uniref:tetratricopeptide repeat protein n=1 Tax=unclassified Pseudomonas TaxID=196821 RepID=UPI001902FA09|nr:MULTISPECIES: tetratricopeptide repeat protein [unclassified Pseudomonas]MBJ9978025.1 sel1 repeat family protein [Pseudomonas sp. S30]MBK0155685.1 sel1 repeat family protein [Pseudomonas sp. S75]